MEGKEACHVLSIYYITFKVFSMPKKKCIKDEHFYHHLPLPETYIFAWYQTKTTGQWLWIPSQKTTSSKMQKFSVNSLFYALCFVFESVQKMCWYFIATVMDRTVLSIHVKKKLNGFTTEIVSLMDCDLQYTIWLHMHLVIYLTCIFSKWIDRRRLALVNVGDIINHKQIILFHNQTTILWINVICCLNSSIFCNLQLLCLNNTSLHNL